MNFAPTENDTNLPEWKREAPQTMDDVTAFLKELLGDKVTVTCKRHGVYVDEATYPYRTLLHCDTNYWKQEAHITKYDSFVGGAGCGAVGVKSVLGLMKEQNAERLVAVTVTGDGRGFWPHMGLIPMLETKPQRETLIFSLASCLTELFKETNNLNGTLSPAVAQNYKNACGRFPLRVFRAASQCMFDIDGQLAHKLFFERLNVDTIGNYILFPGEPGTRKVLQKRLGTTPIFPTATRPNDNGYFWQMYLKEKADFKDFANGKEFHPDLPLRL